MDDAQAIAGNSRAARLATKGPSQPRLGVQQAEPATAARPALLHVQGRRGACSTQAEQAETLAKPACQNVPCCSPYFLIQYP